MMSDLNVSKPNADPACSPLSSLNKLQQRRSLTLGFMSRNRLRNKVSQFHPSDNVIFVIHLHISFAQAGLLAITASVNHSSQHSACIHKRSPQLIQAFRIDCIPSSSNAD